jgi:hypothetical protein
MSAEPLGQLRLIWAALVGGVAVYTFVIFGLLTTGAIGFGVLSPGVLNVVAAAVMLYMGAGVLLRRSMIARIPPDAPRDVRVGQYRAATIIGLGLTESGGLIVITLGMLGSEPLWVLAGGGAAFVMMFLARPTAEEIGTD